MRRIALTVVLLAVAAAGFTAVNATAGDTNTYEVELDNAFGLVNGSEVRVAGVKAGTVTGLDINEAKKALITISVGKEFGEFKSDASCSSEPQSLIAEYFLDCQPGQSPTTLQGPVPVAQTTITVPNDLVQNTLREPFNRQLALIINEFGTALTGNAENLNSAILRGAPALQELKKTLDTLGQQNTVIRDLNANSDAIVQQLTNRREDVVRFIKEAGDTAVASSERRADLALDFKRLPDFLAQLQPTMVELGKFAENGDPVLAELHRSANKLTTFSQLLPGFNNATSTSLVGLGNAAQVGTRALTKGQDEIQQLRTSTTNAYGAADKINQFIASLDNPKNAVEEDARARTDLRDQPGEADRRVGLLNQKVGGAVTEPGYTGLEGLLNYVYYQTGALNQFDQIGHLLHFILFNPSGSSPCGSYNPGPNYPGGSTDPRTAPSCVSILGDNQPGIGDPGTTANLNRYDNSVCPSGVPNDPVSKSICDPTVSTHGASTKGSAADFGTAPTTSANGASPAPTLTPQQLHDIQQGKPLPKPLQQALGLPQGSPLLNQALGALGIGQGAAPQQAPSGGSNPNVLDFLFGP
jgi:ABC-type transporter Mla subunit MlaD